jgi:hypothetical protein
VRKQVNRLGLVLALGVALLAAPASAAKPPAASSVTVYNCIVAPTTPVQCGSNELCAGHLHVTFSSYNSNDPVKTFAYDTSPYLDSRPSATASPSSFTLSCATSDGCVIKGAAEACGSGGVSNVNCGLDAESTTVNHAIELSRFGFNLVFRTWTGVCGPQVCSGC